jgi:hypothetical protein
MKQLTCNGIGLALVLGMLGLPAGAQNQAPSNTSSSSSGSSLGDYARQVRKDPSAKAKPKVFDNDNLPTQDKLSIVGPTAASTTDNSASSQAQSAAPAAASTETKATGDARPGAEMKAPDDKPKSTAKAAEEDEAAKQAALKQWEDKMTSEKEQIDLLTRELDVLQREYQIRAAAMYADVGNRMRNSADWDKQDAQYKQQIADKQKALEDAKQKLEDLQEGARKAGVSASARE